MIAIMLCPYYPQLAFSLLDILNIFVRTIITDPELSSRSEVRQVPALTGLILPNEGEFLIIEIDSGEVSVVGLCLLSFLLSSFVVAKNLIQTSFGLLELFSLRRLDSDNLPFLSIDLHPIIIWKVLASDNLQITLVTIVDHFPSLLTLAPLQRASPFVHVGFFGVIDQHVFAVFFRIFQLILADVSSD